jgi:hypothetical protein
MGRNRIWYVKAIDKKLGRQSGTSNGLMKSTLSNDLIVFRPMAFFVRW